MKVANDPSATVSLLQGNHLERWERTLDLLCVAAERHANSKVKRHGATFGEALVPTAPVTDTTQT